MKSSGQIYQDIELGRARWYHIWWFYITLILVVIALAPSALWHMISSPDARADWKEARQAARERKRAASI